MGYQCQLQTLRLDTGEPTTQGKRKNIPAVTLRLKDSLGLKVGHDSASATYLRQQNVSYSVPAPFYTGDIRHVIGGQWDTLAQIFMQVDDPLPVSVLGVIPEVVLGDTQR